MADPRQTSGWAEGRLGRVLDRLPEAMLVMDRSLRLTHANAYALTLLGRSLADVLGGSLWELLPHLRDTPAPLELEKVFETQSEARFTYRSSFTGRWLEARAFPEGEEIVLHTTDLSDAKEAEARLAATADALPALVFHVDRELRYRFVNRGMEETFARPRAEILGRTVQEIVGERTYADVRPYLQRALAGERTEWAMWVDFPSGRRFTRATYVPSLGPEGETVGIDVLAVDETQARLTEEALTASESRLKLALETARLGTWDHDVASGVTTYSEAVGPMFGRPRAVLALKPEELLPYVHPEDRSRVAEAIRANLERGEPYFVRLRIVGDDGVVRWVESRGDLELGADGTPLRVRGVALDVTEQVEAEQALRESNDRLERAVERRTQELTRANRDLDQFAYSVAHDLRAPLRAIVSSSRMLVEDAGGRLTPEERATLDRQVASALRLAKIVDDLLGFARLADAEPRRETFDMTALARRVAKEVASQRSGRTIEVRDGMRAVGDPSLVGYVLTNLLDNACKFSPAGGEVTVGEQNGAFFVRDRGVGFDMAHAGKLFVAFERLVGQEIEGTGVGLANVRRIVEKHGGRVWAESELGKGATFWFTLT